MIAVSFAYKFLVRIGNLEYLRYIKDKHQMLKLLFSALMRHRYSFMCPVLKVQPFKKRGVEKSLSVNLSCFHFIVCLCHDHMPEITA